ncbi:acetolactate decarboxylase [Methanofollis fontis]|uniref:Alpha-acetolactate decarboxylase n=1 Tax=Methanofollis fontis TaxID=2052832 RepID=A0A483CZG2_9EURY|nr:acetolactate decarboxylase [Methanofollis fontis]TAJ45479.1 acetolactate decarboxylase [Methanofollis fontis]
MIPQTWRLAVLLVLLIASAGFFASSTFRWSEERADAEETIYQVSTLGALLDGVYQDAATIGDLLSHGDIGLGTPGALDGEIVVLDGEAWQVRGDGVVRRMDAAETTAFAAVTPFEQDITFDLPGRTDRSALEEAILAALPSANYPCAVKVTGTFLTVETRSVDRQSPPYPPLAEVTKDQHLFHFSGVKGTLVGFYLPAYMEGVNVPGFHLHFITDDHSGGGHLLDCTVQDARVMLDLTPSVRIVLPENEGFASAPLTTGRSDEVARVEGAPSG